MRGFNIWVTRECNLKCEYCYEGHTKSRVSISHDKVESVICFIIENSSQEKEIVVNFHGGEPLLEIDTIERICIGLIATIKCTFSLTTNGTIVTEKIIRLLKKYAFNVSISIDGKKISHDTNRKYQDGTGSFERVFSTAQLLKENKINLRARMTVTPNNYMLLKENVIFLLENGFNEIVAMPDLYANNWTDDKLKLIEKQLISLYAVNDDDSFVFFDDLCRKSICYGGKQECNIDSDLNIYPCTMCVGISTMNIGNVEMGINQNILKQWNEMNNEELTSCSGCTYLDRCIANRCKIINFLLEGGSGNASPLVCGFTNIVKNALKYKKLLMKGEKYEN